MNEPTGTKRCSFCDDPFARQDDGWRDEWPNHCSQRCRDIDRAILFADAMADADRDEQMLTGLA